MDEIRTLAIHLQGRCFNPLSHVMRLDFHGSSTILLSSAILPNICSFVLSPKRIVITSASFGVRIEYL